MKEINLNDKIECELTDDGFATLFKYYYELKIYNNQFTRIPKYDPKKEVLNTIDICHKDGDKFKFHLWEFMKIFGDSLHMGVNNVPTKDNKIYVKG